MDGARTAVADGQEAVQQVQQYLDLAVAAINALSAEAIVQAADMLLEVAKRGGRIYLVGNGGSAATAAHIANDLNKQANVPGGPKFRAFALCDNVPVLTAWANDVEYAEAFACQLAHHLEDRDLVIAISTSGASLNVLRAVAVARQMGVRTLALTGDHGGELRQLVDHCLCVPAHDIGVQETVHLLFDHAVTVALQMRLDGR